jgi:hypothetical protein
MKHTAPEVFIIFAKQQLQADHVLGSLPQAHLIARLCGECSAASFTRACTAALVLTSSQL